jgi:hypothetical protein
MLENPRLSPLLLSTNKLNLPEISVAPRTNVSTPKITRAPIHHNSTIVTMTDFYRKLFQAKD